MARINNFLTLFSLLFFLSVDGLGQDPVFSQFYANKLQANPAFAGTANCGRVILSYRNEWPGLSNSFITYSSSYDQEVRSLSGGIGIHVLQDKTNSDLWSNLYASGIYAYTFKISRKVSLKAALEGTFIQKSIDASELKYGDMIDVREGFVHDTKDYVSQTSKTSFDLSTGFLLYADQFHFGLSVFHLNEPNESFINGNSVLERRYTISGGYIFNRDDRKSDFSWSPNVIYLQQGEFSQLSIGNYFNFDGFVLGAWSRLDDSFITLVGFQRENWKVGYSYDFTLSSLRNKNSGGSHEISFSFLIPCKEKKPRFKTIMCPSF